MKLHGCLLTAPRAQQPARLLRGLLLFNACAALGSRAAAAPCSEASRPARGKLLRVQVAQNGRLSGTEGTGRVGAGGHRGERGL